MQTVYGLEHVVERHQLEIRQQVAQCRRTAPRRGRRPGTRRERLGWVLVELGLRLALPPEQRVPGVAARPG